MKKSTALILAVSSAALAACNPPDANRTTKSPPGVNQPTAVTQSLISPSAAPAPDMRGPVATSGNTVAPGTDAQVAFANDAKVDPGTAPKSHPSASVSQATAVDAQEAAAKASDTAAADAAKAEVKGEAVAAGTPGTATETSANSPRHGTLTKQEESTEMPKAGQANNYSSTALEEDSGRGRKP